MYIMQSFYILFKCPMFQPPTRTQENVKQNKKSVLNNK